MVVVAINNSNKRDTGGLVCRHPELVTRYTRTLFFFFRGPTYQGTGGNYYFIWSLRSWFLIQYFPPVGVAIPAITVIQQIAVFVALPDVPKTSLAWLVAVAILAQDEYCVPVPAQLQRVHAI